MKRRWALIIAAGLTATVFGPLGLLLWRAGAPGTWTATWMTTEARSALAGTLASSAGASLLAFCLGVPIAWLLVRTNVIANRLLKVVVTLPSAIPPYIWIMGWIALVNSKTGWLTVLFGRWFFDLYSVWGIAFVLGTSGLPMIVLSTAAALSRIDPALEEAAIVTGASPWRAFVDVTLPLIAPSALSGAALVFVFASASFGVPYLLGVSATPPAPTLTTKIYSEILMGEAGLSRAAALCVELFLLALVVLAANAWLARRGRVRLPRGKGQAPRQAVLGRWRWPVSMGCWLVATAMIALPLLAVFWTGVAPSWGRFGAVTFSHWKAVVSSRTLGALVSSLLLAAVASLAVGTLGVVIARSKRRWLEVLADAPASIPGTVLALAFIVAFSQELRFIVVERVAFVLALGNTFWLLLLAYVVKHLSIGVRNTSDALAQADSSLEEAARLCGAGRLRAFRDGVLPQIQRALSGAMLLTFLTCLSELTMSVLLIPTGADVMGTLLFELQSYADPSEAAAIASAMLLVVFAVLLWHALRTEKSR
jgi:iron(III) transport system permease protein